MIRRLLAVFGYRIEYVCEWDVYEFRYDGLDRHAGRPIHPEMGVAPPWAHRRLVRA